MDDYIETLRIEKRERLKSFDPFHVFYSFEENTIFVLPTHINAFRNYIEKKNTNFLEVFCLFEETLCKNGNCKNGNFLEDFVTYKSSFYGQNLSFEELQEDNLFYFYTLFYTEAFLLAAAEIFLPKLE